MNPFLNVKFLLKHLALVEYCDGACFYHCDFSVAKKMKLFKNKYLYIVNACLFRFPSKEYTIEIEEFLAGKWIITRIKSEGTFLDRELYVNEEVGFQKRDFRYIDHIEDGFFLTLNDVLEEMNKNKCLKNYLNMQD